MVQHTLEVDFAKLADFCNLIFVLALNLNTLFVFSKPNFRFVKIVHYHTLVALKTNCNNIVIGKENGCVYEFLKHVKYIKSYATSSKRNDIYFFNILCCDQIIIMTTNINKYTYLDTLDTIFSNLP